MISDNSDNSTIPSEVDSGSECDLSFEIMDEDCDPTLQDLLPVTQPPPKPWDDTSIFASNCTPYVSDSVREAVSSNIVLKSSNISAAVPDGYPEFQVPTVPAQVPIDPISSRGAVDTALSYQSKGRQSPGTRDFHSNQFSLLSAVPVPSRFQVPSLGQHFLNQFRPLGCQ